MRANQISWDGVAEVVAADVAEQGCEALDRAEDHIADRRGDEARQERGRFEVVAVEDLGRQHRPAQRRPEDGPDARTDAGGHGDATVGRFEVEHPGQAVIRSRR